MLPARPLKLWDAPPWTTIAICDALSAQRSRLLSALQTGPLWQLAAAMSDWTRSWSGLPVPEALRRHLRRRKSRDHPELATPPTAERALAGAREALLAVVHPN